MKYIRFFDLVSHGAPYISAYTTRSITWVWLSNVRQILKRKSYKFIAYSHDFHNALKQTEFTPYSRNLMLFNTTKCKIDIVRV